MLALMIMLSACASTPQIAEIPVPAKVTPPPALVRPALPIASLPRDATPGEQEEIWAATVEALQDYAAYLEKLLDGYR